MSLTNDEKAQYVSAIATIWPDMQENQVNNISMDVADLMNEVLQSIKECSKAFAGVHAVFAIFYGSFPPTSWGSILVNALQNGTSVAGWIAALRGQQQYKACVLTAALKWRSVIQEALMGLKK